MLPAILALAQELDLDGSSLIEALVAGYQAEAMVGLALGSASSQRRAFHSTGTVGIAVNAMEDNELERALAYNIMRLEDTKTTGLAAAKKQPRREFVRY
jgi:2-methylcitrate dehydratase PrpD